MRKMKIEVWSDIMCPFCYIGKRKLDKSLASLPNGQDIEVEWKSYQLAPDLVTDPTLNMDEYLSQHKGMSLAQAQQLNAQVVAMAKQEGLTYNLDKAVPANSFKAHILLHFAKQNGKQNDAEELLFKSYFTDGKNIDDMDTLKELVSTLGLDAAAFEAVVRDHSLDDEVKMDVHESRQLGVRGVPFFVYDRKYAISGAQPDELFEQTLQKALAEWKGTSPFTLQNGTEGPSCGPDGCD